ncbi:hypothetical protein [Gluconobacter oxydans]|uniref:hypothetical protein n=1 Tax=Gluconobacter oxydans TaxID=442 RepID=UPI0039EAB09C
MNFRQALGMLQKPVFTEKIRADDLSGMNPKRIPGIFSEKLGHICRSLRWEASENGRVVPLRRFQTNNYGLYADFINIITNYEICFGYVGRICSSHNVRLKFWLPSESKDFKRGEKNL